MPRRIVPLKEEYFDWLCAQVGSNNRPGYRKLCDQLHKKHFRWRVLNDDNRCEDGLNLRDQFIDLLDLDSSHLEVRYFLKGECTVLEMLVALAKRIDEQMFDLKTRENRTEKWFREMITNLDLQDFTDGTTRDDTLDPVAEATVHEVLERFMERTYDFYGRGGLFPLKRRPPHDQTDVEIWYQLMLYLDENYGM